MLADSPKRNLLYILCDDLGFGEIGCYGQKIIKTPTIDQLAKDGIIFNQFYSGHCICAPSRCTLMTGLHTGHAQIRQNREFGTFHSYRGQQPLAPIRKH